MSKIDEISSKSKASILEHLKKLTKKQTLRVLKV